MRKPARILAIGFFSILMLSACAPEVGSEEWCAELKKTPKGEWKVDDVTNYAKHCLVK